MAPTKTLRTPNAIDNPIKTPLSNKKKINRKLS